MSAVDADSGARPYSDVVHVFEPNAYTLPSASKYLADLSERRAFIAELATSEVRGQRSSTFLGELWSLIDPLFQAAVYMFLFTVIRAGSGGGHSKDFVTAIIASVFFFNFTRISIAEGGRAVARHKGLVLNAVFPRALLPIAEVYKGFLSTLPALAVYAVIHVLLGAPITGAITMLPLLMLLQTGINLGLALLLSTATAYFRDVSHLLNYLLRLLMFATPVVYPVSMLSPGIRQLLSWNPLFALFTSYQAVVTGGTPAPSAVLQSIAWAAILLAGGLWAFLRHERSFALHI